MIQLFSPDCTCSFVTNYRMTDLTASPSSEYGNISGEAKKTFRTLRSGISHNKSPIASKFGSFVVQYVLHKCAKLQFDHFRNVFLVRTFLSYVKNDNIKMAANSLPFYTCWLLHFCLLLTEPMKPEVILWYKTGLMILYSTPKQEFWTNCASGFWLDAVNMTSSVVRQNWTIFSHSLFCFP